MSLPSSIKLLKLSTSNSHLNSRRLSSIVNLTSNRLNHEFNKSNKNQKTNIQPTNSTTNDYDLCKQDGQANTDYESKKFNLINDKSRSSSVSSIYLFENLSTKLSKESTDQQTNCSSFSSISSNDQPSKMGSSSSKCTKITDQPLAYSNNGWINCHQNNLPQLNQPYLHHSCSMINLADCACCHHSFAHSHDGKF